jgi:methionyl-tRNA formyltransferase
MRIAFFWTGEFSKNIFEKIFAFENIEIPLVVSAPDKPVGRKQILEETPLKKSADLHNIKVLQPEKIRKNEEFFDRLRQLNLDFIVVVAYGKIVPKEILDIPKFWCINIHGSLLPLYRWASPIQEAIKRWDTKTWLTIMYMSEGMDEWDILTQEEIKIDIVDKATDIFKKFEEIGPRLLYDNLKKILNNEIIPQKQDEKRVNYCTKITKEEGKIDFKNQKAQEIYNRFRAYFPWPGIYTYFEEKKFDIEECCFCDSWEFEKSFSGEQLLPWKVLKIDKKTIGIVCADRKILILNQVKLEWKKSMDIVSFINGNKKFLEYNF